MFKRKYFFSTLILVLITLIAGPGWADVGLQQTPLGYQQITSLATSQSLTVPAGAKMAVITVETQAVRYRDDGTAPTATVGQPIATGTVLTYTGTLSAIQFIEQTASAKIDILYYK